MTSHRRTVVSVLPLLRFGDGAEWDESIVCRNCGAWWSSLLRWSACTWCGTWPRVDYADEYIEGAGDA